MQTFLFPPLSTADRKPITVIPPYCIQSETRSALFDLIFTLLHNQAKRNIISYYLSKMLDAGIFPKRSV
jgi:hypothetical protein